MGLNNLTPANKVEERKVEESKEQNMFGGLLRNLKPCKIPSAPARDEEIEEEHKSF